MPTHTLPRGVAVIDALTSLGSALGYVSERERPVERGRANPPAVDVAWLLDKGQEYPIMIFEVESLATNAAANNPVKVFGQSTERFEKPLFFFHIFVAAGPETSRIENLKQLFGTHNYRAYRLDQNNLEVLLRDVFSQHRRLQKSLNLGPLLDQLRSGIWLGVSLRNLLLHLEALRFDAAFLGEYAARGVSDPEFRGEFLRLLERSVSVPAAERKPEGYKTYIGQTWAEPLHMGVLSLANPDSGDWLGRLRDWQEHTTYMTMIGPHFGLSRDYDDFVLGFAPVLWALVTALMYKVSGAAKYICTQIGAILERLSNASLEASFFTAVWALHVAAAAGDDTQYEVVRAFINERGGMALDILYEPPSMVSVVEPDEEWTTAVTNGPLPVPALPDFREELSRRYSGTSDLDFDLFALALDVLTRDAALYEWSANVARLLHATSGVIARKADV